LGVLNRQRRNVVNPVDWGNTPLSNAAARGFIAALLISAGVVAGKLLTGADMEEAVLTGITAGTPLLVGLLGFGAMDQNRANTGVVIAGDVPVFIEAEWEEKHKGSRDVGPGDKPVVPRTTEQVAAAWTSKAKNGRRLTS
jgi:hypothetical protein